MLILQYIALILYVYAHHQNPRNNPTRVLRFMPNPNPLFLSKTQPYKRRGGASAKVDVHGLALTLVHSKVHRDTLRPEQRFGCGARGRLNWTLPEEEGVS